MVWLAIAGRGRLSCCSGGDTVTVGVLKPDVMEGRLMVERGQPSIASSASGGNGHFVRLKYWITLLRGKCSTGSQVSSHGE